MDVNSLNDGNKEPFATISKLFRFVLKMMDQNITGTINLTNPGLISHNEMLEMYKEIVDPLFTWKNFSQEEQCKILASERSNNFLDTTKLETLFPEVRNIKDSVKDCLIQYKKKLDLEPPICNLLITDISFIDKLYNKMIQISKTSIFKELKTMNNNKYTLKYK